MTTNIDGIEANQQPACEYRAYVEIVSIWKRKKEDDKSAKLGARRNPERGAERTCLTTLELEKHGPCLLGRHSIPGGPGFGALQALLEHFPSRRRRPFALPSFSLLSLSSDLIPRIQPSSPSLSFHYLCLLQHPDSSFSPLTTLHTQTSTACLPAEGRTRTKTRMRRSYKPFQATTKGKKKSTIPCPKPCCMLCVLQL